MKRVGALLLAAVMASAICGCESSLYEAVKLPTLTAVHGTDAKHVWAVGNSEGILFFDGQTWVRQRGKVGTRGPGLRSVFALDDTHVWAVGEAGTVLFFNGTSWSRQDSGTPLNLNGVCAQAPDRVWAVGARGTVINFDGRRWSLRDSGVPWDIRCVASAANGTWASGDGGIIALDSSWKAVLESDRPVPAISSRNGLLYAVESPGFGPGKMAVSTVMSDGDGWQSIFDLADITATDVSVVDKNDIWVCGLPGSLVNYDGKVWLEPDIGTGALAFNGIFALDAKHVWAVGNGIKRGQIGTGLLYFYDGTTWTKYEDVR